MELEGDLHQPHLRLPSSPQRHAEQLPHLAQRLRRQGEREMRADYAEKEENARREPATYSSYHAASAARRQILSMFSRRR